MSCFVCGAFQGLLTPHVWGGICPFCCLRDLLKQSLIIADQNICQVSVPGEFILLLEYSEVQEGARHSISFCAEGLWIVAMGRAFSFGYLSWADLENPPIRCPSGNRPAIIACNPDGVVCRLAAFDFLVCC
jgi:hypothetical protein